MFNLVFNRKTILLLIFTIISGCSIGSGAPLIRTTADDGEGRLVPDCENISRADITSSFITNSYLTTWGSVWREGAAEGVYQGSKESFKNLRYDSNSPIIQSYVNAMLPSSTTFCKVYHSDLPSIFQLIPDLLPALGYELDYVSEVGGIVTTKYVYRAHDDVTWKCSECTQHRVILRSSARWKDRYVIKIGLAGESKAFVKVFRDVYISRRDKKEWSNYLRATSVGHNEAVILNRIDDLLNQAY